MSLTGKEKESQLFEQLIDKYGFDAQLLKCVEEMSECSVALMHYRDHKSDKISVCEELADVMIMCRQMALYIDPLMTERFIRQKTLGLKKRFECNAV
jgi:NTP pyrophosphatase (non-canonical NTP hydrolase)